MSITRRFFLDDGRARKQWQISQRGTRQIVHFGRIGAKLRSREKVFDSQSDSRENTASLISAKLKGGYVEIDASLLTIKRPPRLRSAKPGSIRTLERQIGASLPAEYRAFLQTVNGGVPDPGFVAIPGVPHIANVSVGFIYGLYASDRPAQSLSWGIKMHCPVLPPGHLPIAYDSDIFTLSLNKKRGCVYFWDHETDTSNNDEKYVESDAHLLAGSFDEFLTRIAVFTDVDE